MIEKQIIVQQIKHYEAIYNKKHVDYCNENLKVQYFGYVANYRNETLNPKNQCTFQPKYYC